MTIKLALTAEQEHILKQAANKRGLDTDRLLHEMLEAALAQLKQPADAPLERMPGLHAGQYWISEDFDDPLPDSFWLGAA